MVDGELDQYGDTIRSWWQQIVEGFGLGRRRCPILAFWLSRYP